MKGLLIKEKNIILTSCKTFFLIPLFFAAVLIISAIKGGGYDNWTLPVGFIFVFMSIMPINVMNTELTSRWNTSCLTMPYSRREIVTSKYLTSFIVDLAMAVVVLVVCGICSLMGAGVNMGVIIQMIFRGFAMGLIPATAYLPVNYKMYDRVGAGRMITGGLVGGICSGMNMSFMEKVPDGSRLMTGSFWFFVVMLVLFVISWAISVSIFERKDCA